MRTYESLAMSWLFGYFILLWPYIYAIDGSLIGGLIMGIIGVLGTILLLVFGRKEEFKING